jgi:hypothetical protein
MINYLGTSKKTLQDDQSHFAQEAFSHRACASGALLYFSLGLWQLDHR